MGLAVKLGISVSGRSYVSYVMRADRHLLDGLAYVWSQTSGMYADMARFRTDRDAGRWNVESAEIDRRRQTFWELYVYDLLQVRGVSLTPSSNRFSQRP